MVVQIVTEHMNQVYGVFSCRTPCNVSREKHESDVSNFVVNCGIRVLQLSRGLSVTEKYRGGGMRGPKAFFELLHENFSDYHVVFVAKTCAKDHCHSVGLRFHVPGNNFTVKHTILAFTIGTYKVSSFR